MQHDALHMQRLAVPLLPRLETGEDGAEVRLVGARHDAEAADGLEGLDAFRLRQNLFHPAQHRVRSLEGGARRQLDTDAHEALILVGDEPRRQCTAEDPDSEHDDADYEDREHGFPYQHPRHAYVSARRAIE